MGKGKERKRRGRKEQIEGKKRKGGKESEKRRKMGRGVG